MDQKITILSFSRVFPNSSPPPHGLLSQSDDDDALMVRGVSSSGQDARPVLSCDLSCDRTGRLFVEMPFETTGHDRSQDVSY